VIVNGSSIPRPRHRQWPDGNGVPEFTIVAALNATLGADFSLYVRTYWPGPAITSGKWTPPPVAKAQ